MAIKSFTNILKLHLTRGYKKAVIHAKAYILLELKLILVGIIVSIFSFPEPAVFGSGIDESLIWVFNHLFTEGSKLGQHIIFPHGPLAFLMYPMPENFIYAIIISFILKTLLVVQIYRIAGESKFRWFATFISTLIICTIAHFNLLIIFNVMLAFLAYYESKLNFDKYLGIFLTAFAIYIKAYVGIVSLTICAGFWLFFLVTEKKYLKSLIDLGVGLLMLIILWLIIFGSFNHIISFFTGMVQLAQDNSAAAAYYPTNNWFLLTLFLVSAFGIVLWNKDKRMIYIACLGTLALFASWKHGMAREDIYHTKNLLSFLITYFLIIAIYAKRNQFIYLILGLVSISAFYANIENVRDYKPISYNFSGINNFNSWVFDKENFNNNLSSSLNNSLSEVKISDNYIKLIGNSTIDIYPWDYAVIAANNFNWQPRPVIQSYASYTKWLDNKNQKFINSTNAPEYFIWDTENKTPNIYGGNFESIDYRYLLNDEPLFLSNFIANYELMGIDNKFYIYKKRNNKLKIETEIILSLSTEWEEWIGTPESTTGITQAKLDIDKNISGKLKSFFYKDEMVYVELKLKNGMINKYRIVPKNALYGIWVNPYINSVNVCYQNEQVEAIRFTSSNSKRFKNNIKVEWVKTNFTDKNSNYLDIKSFWDIPANDKIVEQFHELNFDNKATGNWLGKDTSLTVNIDNNKCMKVLPKSFSPSFVINADSTIKGSCTIKTTVDINTNGNSTNNNIILVIEGEKTNGSKLWNGLNIDDQIINSMNWNSVFNQSEISFNTEQSTLKVYIWNNSDIEILIDNFTVTSQFPN